MRTFPLQKMFGFTIILALLFSAFHPALVLADGDTPIIETTEENTPVGEVTEEIQVKDTTEEPGETGEAGVQDSTEEGTEVPEETTEVVGSGDSEIDETPVPEGYADGEDAGETPIIQETEITEEPSPTATADPEEVIPDILEAAVEAGVQLADGDGDPVIMASEESLELMESVPDPWIERGGITYRFLSDCTGYPDTATQQCTVSTTPVQAAIDFANPGETVYLGAGTFQEDIEITKDLTLQGTVGTIIQSPNTINTEFSTGSGGKSPIIYVNNATVNIRSITVDGNGNVGSNAGFLGIGFYNAGGEVSDCLITNIIDSPMSGSQRGVGLYVYNDDGVARSIDVFDNEFTNFQKNAMALSGDGLTVNVHDNTIHGSGQTSVIAQNGIQVSYGATGSITNNTIDDIWYTGANWGASAVLVYSAGGTVDVSNNTIQSSQYSVYVQDSLANIMDNTIEDGQYGLIVYSPSNGTQVTGNTFRNNELGVYSDEAGVVLRENLFIGNLDGVYFDLASGSGDAIYNYWGCDEGPDGASGNCNTSFGANYDPWLMDEDGDFVFTSSDGSGGYVDNCPTVANPGQEDSDGDGIGDACESTPVTPTPVPPDPAQPFNNVIPITGGDVNRLVCPAGSNQVLFELENGNQVRFVGLCDLDAVVNTLNEQALPHELPAGTAYVSDLLIQVLDDGTILDILSGGSVEMSFLVPNDVDINTLALYYWDEDAETWFEIALHSPDSDYPMQLSEDSSNKDRMIYAGLSSIINRAISAENFTGLFVLVSK